MVKPKPEYLRALSAMRSLGVPQKTVAPVLTKLLQLYNNNWEFIEAEEYRVLENALFECPQSKEKEIEVEWESTIACERSKSEPSSKRLRMNSGEAEALREMNNRPLTPARARALPTSCLKDRGAGSGCDSPESHSVDEMNAESPSSSAKLARHPDSLDGASTRNVLSDLASNHFNKSNNKASIISSVLQETEIPLEYRSSLELGSNSIDRRMLRQPSAKETSQNGFDCNRRCIAACSRTGNSGEVFHEKESKFLLRQGLEGSEKEFSVSDKKKRRVHANGKCKGKVKQSLAQDHDFVEEGDGRDLSLQVYKNQQIIFDKKKLTAGDVAKGKEKVKIPVADDNGNGEHLNFCYIATNLIYQNAFINISLARISDEDCCLGCSGDCLSSPIPCACARETGGEFAYTSQGLLKEKFLEACVLLNQEPEGHHFVYCKNCPSERYRKKKLRRPCKGHLVKKFIKECWSKCGCSMQCGNRVVQRGITRHLQVFWTPKGKGWGLRVAEDLPKGAFVCEYVGEILTNTELHERNKQRSDNERHVYPVLLDADWASESILKDDEALCLDATFYGNVARFINHRCEDANLLEIPVEVETVDRHYYHVAFFTNRDVKAFEELTWDYGIDFDDHNHPVKAFECSCGSTLCRDKKGRG
ncbi:hypothetical protein Dimus_034569 [Dionaea muscipula]